MSFEIKFKDFVEYKQSSEHNIQKLKRKELDEILWTRSVSRRKWTSNKLLLLSDIYKYFVYYVRFLDYVQRKQKSEFGIR